MTLADPPQKNLYVYNGGFLTQSRVRRILELSGYAVKLGTPGEEGLVGVWGHSPTAPRGEGVARKKNAPLLRVEDSFLRSVKLGRDGDPPIGLNVDRNGAHYDPRTISDLEQILTHDPLDNTHLLSRARAGIDQMRRAHISKYNAFDPAVPAPEPGYVLVIDQSRKDASIRASGADSNTFKEMLFYAQTEHPAAKIIIKTHPDSVAGYRDQYFTDQDETDRITVLSDPISPWHLFEGAIAVYTVSSQLGFEAIFAGHKPIVFGQPFYMGWDLTEDRTPLQRRQRRLTAAQLFAGAMILYPKWYDPFHDRLCSFEEALETLACAARAWRDDQQGWTAIDMRLWKRGWLQKMLGGQKPVRFQKTPKGTPPERVLYWGNKGPDGGTRIEDGFLRSKGLGAALTPPLSIGLDQKGMYFDASRPSRLEDLINASEQLSDAQHDRAAALIDRIRDANLSKYNTGGAVLPELPKGRRILVPGQVADDASITYGCDAVADNLTLLKEVRKANPAAVIAYKPHPDVEAGLRPGQIERAEEHADVVLNGVDAIAALSAVDEVWTMTSLIGFEALLRGIPVTCFGSPFYAHWGLTHDRSLPIPRRETRARLTGLVHAALIDYPRYRDPVTGLPCPVEVIVDRIENGDLPRLGAFNRTLSKVQGLFSGYAHLWR